MLAQTVIAILRELLRDLEVAALYRLVNCVNAKNEWKEEFVINAGWFALFSCRVVYKIIYINFIHLDLSTGISTQTIPTVVKNAIAISLVFWVVLLFAILTMVNVFASLPLLLEVVQSAPMAVIICKKTIFLVAVVSTNSDYHK